MSILHTIRRRLAMLRNGNKSAMPPADAYNIWADSYDAEPDNLMVVLDESVFAELISGMDMEGKVIADIGCGTGRHWKRLLEQKPAMLAGFDVSRGMLDQLQRKYPAAVVSLVKDEHLDSLADQSCDLVMSTLAFAHFPDGEKMLQEWCRVLKPGGSIMITDGHPVSFQKGADITFASGRKSYAIQHYIYPLEWLQETMSRMGCIHVALTERVIDERVKHYYEEQHAMATYAAFEGVPIIYGLHFRKAI